MKGLLAGIVSGAVVLGLGLAVGERHLPVVDLKPAPPRAGEVAVPAGSGFNTERPDSPPILPGTEAPPESAAAPVVATPGPESGALPDTTPLDTPQAAPLEATAMTPPQDAPTPVIVSGDAAEGLQSAEISQPDAPAVDAAVVPDVTASLPRTEAQPAPPAEPIAATDPLDDGAVGLVPEDVAAAPDLSSVAQPDAPRADVSVTAGETAAPPQTGLAPATPSDPVAAADPSVEPAEIAALPETGGLPEAPTGAAAEVDTPPIAVPDAPEGLRLPVPQFEDMAPDVTTDRLPRIGETPEQADVPLLEPALVRNAIPFETTGGPLVALVLVDVGPVRPDPSVLATFPGPLTVAIDPMAADAHALMEFYRAAGLEVAILTPLPEGASPADVEVAFQIFLSTLPEAVAVMDMPEAVLQESRPRAAQVIEILSETGHGMITYDKGLNTALQIASRSGVPAATVFRDIDPGHHDVAAMKRFLDQAAFRAGLDGMVILKAESRPETMTALTEWILGNRAATVTLAPVSEVLKR